MTELQFLKAVIRQMDDLNNQLLKLSQLVEARTGKILEEAQRGEYGRVQPEGGIRTAGEFFESLGLQYPGTAGGADQPGTRRPGPASGGIDTCEGSAE